MISILYCCFSCGVHRRRSIHSGADYDIILYNLLLIDNAFLKLTTSNYFNKDSCSVEVVQFLKELCMHWRI
jgi:hypothetical protein